MLKNEELKVLEQMVKEENLLLEKMVRDKLKELKALEQMEKYKLELSKLVHELVFTGKTDMLYRIRELCKLTGGYVQDIDYYTSYINNIDEYENLVDSGKIYPLNGYMTKKMKNIKREEIGLKIREKLIEDYNKNEKELLALIEDYNKLSGKIVTDSLEALASQIKDGSKLFLE